MRAVLYVGHGSRIAKGNRQFVEFIEKVKEKVLIPIQETAFIEKAEPTIRSGISTCIDKGATEIAIVPVLLLAAAHAKNDLPQDIELARIQYPHVKITYGRPIGPDVAVIDMLIDRIKEQGCTPSDFNKREKVTILLVGRGSSDLQANSDLVKISRMLWELCPVDHVEYGFLAATSPTFQESLQKVVETGNEKIIVLPYLLFTGVLMKRMEQAISDLNKNTEKTIVLSNYLGYHPKLVDIIKDRTYEALTSKNYMSCDSCLYRLQSNLQVKEG